MRLSSGGDGGGVFQSSVPMWKGERWKRWDAGHAPSRIPDMTSVELNEVCVALIERCFYIVHFFHDFLPPLSRLVPFSVVDYWTLMGTDDH